MVTASIAFPVDVRPARGRAPLRERLSVGGAAAVSIIGIIAAMGIATLALLTVPVAAIIVFGPALHELI